ncbi:hypothetical protein HW132_28900 [Brasilonema sp. CT11]|nr:hypothetical protein [Brasilonema sp. CT11]
MYLKEKQERPPATPEQLKDLFKRAKDADLSLNIINTLNSIASYDWLSAQRFLTFCINRQRPA